MNYYHERKNIKRVFMCCLTALAANTYAQNFNWVSSTEGNTWKQSKVKLQSSAGQTPLLDISGTEEGTTFKHGEPPSTNCAGMP